MVPDHRALKSIQGLWRQWLRNELGRGYAPWRNLFATLRDMRPWGPEDRVHQNDASILQLAVEERDDDELFRLEIELVYRASKQKVIESERELTGVVRALGGDVLSRSRIEDIGYHGLLVDLPVHAVRQIASREPSAVSALDSVMYIRAQSIASDLEVGDISASSVETVPRPLGEPILALLDGPAIAAHALLSNHLVVDDQFDLERITPVGSRVHGTAMASLLVHGDRNKTSTALARRIILVPVLDETGHFPADRLIIDLVYSAVMRMKQGADATAEGVVIINLSLGNPRRPFHGQLSPWARLIDRLAYRFGILFIVSAGNVTDGFSLDSFSTRTSFEDAVPEIRAKETLRSIGKIVAERRLFSPAETVNGLTVGAVNDDAVSATDRTLARTVVDPYGELRMTNPSCTLGPGFAQSTKPDICLPGAREHLLVVGGSTSIEVQPAKPGRAAGLRVAAPPRDGRENSEGFTNGTSAAAALASRTAHRIHDALEATYGERFLGIPPAQRAVLLKALVAHSARWPNEAAALIREIIGPSDAKQHVRQKDNIRRFFGFGIVDQDEAVACAADRATFWAVGRLAANRVAAIEVPVPAAIGGRSQPHAMAATLAWFTPTAPGRKSYRSVRLKLLDPDGLEALRVKSHGDQPDTNQARRGTLIHRSWRGDRAPVVGPDMTISLTAQRDPDQGADIDDPIDFGIAVTLSMPGVVELYDEVRQRLGIPLPA